MKFFLSLKHWQLFILTWIAPLVIQFMSIGDPFVIVKYFPIMMAIFTFLFYGWLWSICNVLHSKLPAGVEINKNLIHILFAIPVLYIAYLIIFMFNAFNAFSTASTERSEPGGGSIALLLIAHLGSMVCIFMGLRYAAKIMKSVELGRMAKFSDYAGEFFMMWFQPVGIWMIQPRLNKLVKEE